MAQAVRDTQGRYFHEKCAPVDETAESVEVEGVVCEECEEQIEDDDSEEPTSVEDEEDK